MRRKQQDGVNRLGECGFPQLSGMGHGVVAQRYAIQNIDQARRYLAILFRKSSSKNVVMVQIGASKNGFISYYSYFQ